MPSASLLHLNRNTLPSILVVGGAPQDRVAVTRTLHRQSVLAERVFCAVDARRQAAALEQALLAWLGYVPSAPALDCERGTLLVDDVAALPATVQRLLLRWARRLSGLPADARRASGPARLAAGCPVEPAEEVSHGRLLADLHDSLDKIRIHLESATSGFLHRVPTAPRRKARHARDASAAVRMSQHPVASSVLRARSS